MILLVALCVAMSMSAQGAARTKPATATQRTMATPPRTNAAAMRTAVEQRKIGMQYYHEKKYAQALVCLEKAANLGLPDVQAVVAMMYHKGEGTSQNFKKAFYWFEKASNQQFSPAQYGLGMMYYKGEGVTQNLQKAFYWMERSAKQGYENAQLMLGMMYYKGEGTAQNYQKAFSWFEKVANKKEAFPENAQQAMIVLGRMYEDGAGVPRDHQKALYWIEKSANLGSAAAKDILSHMREEDLANADKPKDEAVLEINTANDIIRKYKAVPEVFYQDMTSEYLAAQQRSYEMMGHEYIPQDVWNAYLKGLKTYETIMIMPIREPFDEEKQKELWNDLEKMKGYELVHGIREDSIPIVTNHPFKDALEVLFPTKSGNAKVYAKTEGNRLLDVILYGQYQNYGVILHRAYETPKDVLNKYVECLIPMTEAVNAQREEMAKARAKADSEDIYNIVKTLEALEEGDCLVVIGGKQHPELKSEEEARAWMEKNNVRFQIENILTGDNLKAKYPDTDKTVVYEFILSE